MNALDALAACTNHPGGVAARSTRRRGNVWRFAVTSMGGRWERMDWLAHRFRPSPFDMDPSDLLLSDGTPVEWEVVSVEQVEKGE
jgi:hypothetical protein